MSQKQDDIIIGGGSAGCVQILGVSSDNLRGRRPQFANHRAIWYYALLKLTKLQWSEIAKAVGLDASAIQRAILRLEGDKLAHAEKIVKKLQMAEYE